MRLPFTLLALAACATTPTRSDPVPSTDVVLRLYEDVLNQKRFELLEELVAPDFVGATGERGPQGFAATLGALASGFPDIHYVLERPLADGNRVAVFWTWEGTHQGEYRGLAPTGTRVKNGGSSMFELKDGRIVRAWSQTDRLGFLQQLGVAPAELGRPPLRQQASTREKN